MMYSVRTKFGMTYNFIISWKKWDIDETFLEFTWGRDNPGKLILPISEILVIKKDN